MRQHVRRASRQAVILLIRAGRIESREGKTDGKSSKAGVRSREADHPGRARGAGGPCDGPGMQGPARVAFHRRLRRGIVRSGAGAIARSFDFSYVLGSAWVRQQERA